MAIFHITLRQNWEKIQEGGFLVPSNELNPNATGGDVDKVSAFYGIERNDVEALRELRKAVASAKNHTLTSIHYRDEDYVVLEVICFDIEWHYDRSQKKELIHPFGNLPEKIYEKLEGYCKTNQRIPSSCLKELSL